MRDNEMGWWLLALIASGTVAFVVFMLQWCVVLAMSSKKKNAFPVFEVYFGMHQYSIRIACFLIATVQIIFVANVLVMGDHVLALPQLGAVPPIFGIFASIVGLSLNLHCFIRWLFGVLVVGLIVFDIIGSTKAESDIRCVQSGPCDDNVLPAIEWLWTNFIFRNVSLAVNIYTVLVTTFISWEMGCCCVRRSRAGCCSSCDRYPLVAWEPTYDSRWANADTTGFDRTRLKELSENARKRFITTDMIHQVKLTRANTYDRVVAKPHLQARMSSTFGTDDTVV